MARHFLSRSLSWPLVLVVLGCTRDVPTDVRSSVARSPIAGSPASAAIASVPCPPAIPAGYELVTCFDFTSIPGVWHGFIMGNAIAPTPPAEVGTLSADYLLISPSGLTRIVPNVPPNVSNGEYTFEPEFFNDTWIDVLRFVTPSGDPPYQLTLAVAKRPLTPALQVAAIVSQVEQLRASGALGGGQANALTTKLRNAIEQLEAGDAQAAANVLRAFVNQVNALMSGGNSSLTELQAKFLLDAANALLARLG
jgi:hypothetical protein